MTIIPVLGEACLTNIEVSNSYMVATWYLYGTYIIAGNVFADKAAKRLFVLFVLTQKEQTKSRANDKQHVRLLR
jgi:hypothetical protein